MLSIISTVGTTVFGGYGTPLNTAVREFEASKPQNIEKIVDGKSFPGEEIYQQASADLKAKTGDFLRKACAEINAIEGFHERHSVAAGNSYHFLASHTATGVLAARVLRDFCLDRYQASSADVRLVQGLQVQEERKFRSEGLPFLIQIVYQLLDNAKKNHLRAVLNPTGGFKAAIPYMTLVGMIRQVEVGLIHETSKTLITLAGLPITLDLVAIGQISSILEQCDAEQKNGIQRTVLTHGLGLTRNELIESHPLWSLFEQFDSEHYILSGIGSIALAELRAQAKQQIVWLSKQASDRLERDFKPGSDARRNFETILSRIHAPENRVDPYRHTYKGSDFPAFKYKGNERLFYYEHPDGYILILELAQHVSDSDWSYDRVPGDLQEYAPYKQWERAE